MANGLCNSCGSELKLNARFCTKCGTPVIGSSDNHCENPYCIRHTEKYCFEEDDFRCDQCGELTTIGKIVDRQS